MPARRPKQEPQNLDQALSPEQIAIELALSAQSAIYWIETYCKILIRNDDGSRLYEPFVLWKFQQQLIAAFQKNEEHFCILKARQLGITTTVCAYVLWRAMYKSNAYILLLSKREPEATKLLERIKATYERLPAWMKEFCPPADIWNNQTISFGNGSKVESMAATEGAGRSDTASLVFIDEADYVADLAALYSAVKPTVDGPGGQLIIASTSQGPMRFFHDLYGQAMQRKGKLRAVFIPWFAHPGRTPEWLARETADYSETQRKREYPAVYTEAFAANQALVYPVFDRGTHMESLRYDPRTRTVTTKRYGTFTLDYVAAGIDFNMSQPGCLVIAGIAKDGTIVEIDGYYGAEIPVVAEDPHQLTWVKIARSMSRTYAFTKLAADWDSDAIDALRRAGLPAIKAIKDVKQGIGLVYGALAGQRPIDPRDPDGPKRPTMIFSDRLDYIPTEMAAYAYREIGGTVSDVVLKRADHHADALRYCTNVLVRGPAKISLI
jgi:hypothetical protein